MVWSFVYLAVRSLFGLVLLFGRSDRSKELEILVLRHELVLLQRRSGRPRIERSDRALLATLSRALPRRRWATLSVSPETVLRWHRHLVTRRWTYPRVKPGRPPLERPRRELILRFARENPHWGYQRIAGELKQLGLGGRSDNRAEGPEFRGHSASTRSGTSIVAVIPAPAGRQHARVRFLHGRDARLAADLRALLPLARDAPARVRRYHTKPRQRLGHAAGSQPRQASRRGRNFGLLIHDRDTKFSRLFDEVFCTEGIEVIRTPVQAPNANAFAERWVRTVRNDCLDRILIIGSRHPKESCARTPTTTTSTGHTERSSSPLQAARSPTTTATPRRRLQFIAATCSAD
jgi:putative transposase